MNPLRLEVKRLLYSLWMLPAILLVTVGLALFTYRTGISTRQLEGTVCLALLLSTVEYHIILYIVLAVAIIGVDVSTHIPRWETMSGGSPLRFLLRKAILYIIAVLACELFYLALPLLLWGVSPSSLWPLFPTRLFLNLGIAMPFFLLQSVLSSLQAMLIGDAAAAILWIGLHEDDLNIWYMALLEQHRLPGNWFLFVVVSIVLSSLICFGVFPLSQTQSGKLDRIIRNAKKRNVPGKKG